MFKRVVLIANLTAIVILLVMLNFTNPADIGPLGVLLFFILTYVIVYGIASLIVKLFRKLLQKKGEMTKKDYLYAAVLAFAPIMLLLAQSLGSFGWFTILLVGLFEVLGCFLVSKRG